MSAKLEKYVILVLNHTTLNSNNGIYITLLSKATELSYAPAEWEAAGRYFKTVSHAWYSQQP